MRLLLTGRNVEVTPALRQALSRRLAHLDRVVGDSAVSAQVVLTREKYRHVTDITLHMRGDKMLTGVGAATTWPLSMKEAVAHVEQQALRVKEKWQQRKRRPRTAAVVAAEAGRFAPPEAVEPSHRVVRVRHVARPMTVDQAAVKLAATTDPFLVFRQPETGRLSVLVARKDGAFGLIEPDA